MATVVLSSQNHRFDHRRNPNSRNSNQSHAAKTNPRRRKQTPPATKSNLVMGQVKILKRGESLNAFPNKENKRPSDLIVPSIKRIGPEPEIMQKQIGAFKGLEILARDYAGSGCSVSPPPSSVPIPGFLGKN